MCIIILAPTGVVVPNDKLYRAWTNNQDGAGFGYVDNNDNVVVSKRHSTYGAFHKEYVEAVQKFGATSPFLIHFRIRSQGDKGMENTHPFMFRPEEGPAGMLAHNGTMFTPTGAWTGKDDDKYSDTRVFAERLGPKLAYDYVQAGRALLAGAIGSSRMVFLYANREYVILNEERPGLWEDGIWYSNGGCVVGATHTHITT